MELVRKLEESQSLFVDGDFDLLDPRNSLCDVEGIHWVRSDCYSKVTQLFNEDAPDHGAGLSDSIQGKSPASVTRRVSGMVHCRRLHPCYSVAEMQPSSDSHEVRVSGMGIYFGLFSISFL